MAYAEIMEHVARGFEAIGAVVLVAGLVLAIGLSAGVWRRTRDGGQAFQTMRRTFGGVLLLGLEVLVAADLLLTVAVEPTLESVAVLGLIVVIRTILSFSLEIEIEGMAPWRRFALTGPSHIAAAVRDAHGRTADG